MSNEPEERLKQIRERSESRKRVAGNFEWARVAVQEWKDIDLLLSLIDSKPDNVGTGMAALAGYETGLADGVTRMREACVEKVRKVLKPYELEFREKTEGRVATNMVDYVAGELESLTLADVGRKP